MKTAILEIKGIHCKSCEMLIGDTLIELGVKELLFNGNRLTVSFDENKLTLHQIKQAIRGEGYKVN